MISSLDNLHWPFTKLKNLWSIIMLSSMMMSLFFSLVGFNIVVVQSLSHVWLFSILWTVASQASCPSPSPIVCSNSYPLSWWCYLTLLCSVAPFSFYLQSFPASGSFPMSKLVTSDGQSIGASALPVNIQCWFPLWLTSFISRSKGLLRVFLSITIQKHQFFGPQPSLWSHSHIRTWLLEKP